MTTKVNESSVIMSQMSANIHREPQDHIVTVCDRQNSENLHRLNSIQSEVHSKIGKTIWTKPDEIPIKELSHTASEVKKVVDKSTSLNTCRCVFLLFTVITSAIVSALTCVYIVPQFFGADKQLVINTDITEESYTAKLTAPENNGSKFHWATFYLDSWKFYKGIHNLPWKMSEERNSGITLTEKGCFQLSKASVYELYSKITFEFTEENITDVSLYHNVQLIRDRGRDETRIILDKNIISEPFRPNSHSRVFQTSSLLVLGEFQAGDMICICVQDTSMVYGSNNDNSVKIIQKGD